MALPDDGPCGNWAEWEDVTGCCRAEVAALPEAVQAVNLGMATEILWSLSGRRFPGICHAVRSFCVPSVACGGCSGRCRCGPYSRIDLGGSWPVATVETVTVDGVDLLEGADYRVDDWRYLVRLDGESWPATTDLTDPEALEVHWTYGREVSGGARRVAATLACELSAACIPGATCNFPQRITGMTAEGVTFTLVDPSAIIARGATGLYEVDLWLHAVNHDTPSAGGIFDPGACAKAVATDTGSSGAT